MHYRYGWEETAAPGETFDFHGDECTKRESCFACYGTGDEGWGETCLTCGGLGWVPVKEN